MLSRRGVHEERVHESAPKKTRSRKRTFISKTLARKVSDKKHNSMRNLDEDLGEEGLDEEVEEVANPQQDDPPAEGS